MLKLLALAILLLGAEASAAHRLQAHVRAPEADSSMAIEQAMPSPGAEKCCKVCHKGKACGDTCIARDKECREPPGCACDR